MKRIVLGAIWSLSILLFAACVPAVEPDAASQVAVINGPEDARVEGIADAFAAAIEPLDTPGFEVFRDVALAGVEVRRNLGGSQAVPSAARIGRSFGAELTLMLGAVDIQRDVFEAGRDQVRIEVRLSVAGVLVRARDERVLARIESRTFSGQRFADASATLPELQFDPTAVELGSRGAAALAPVFREIIASQVNESSSE